MKNPHKKSVKIGSIQIGSGFPVAIQSMTNTDTANVEATVEQIIALSEAGSEIVRMTVNNEESARAVPEIKSKLLAKGMEVPLVGCFHYNGHILLSKIPECAEALDKLRINPGNVGFGSKRDKNFETMINIAIQYNKPVRIGVNWGSLDQSLLAKLMDENANLRNPLSSEEVMIEAIISSALESASLAEKIGLPENMIVISAKVSRVVELQKVYAELAKRSNYALHLGLTEAGMGLKGAVATASALAPLLLQGIGDTIRCSLTPEPNGDRTEEVRICKEILQSLSLRHFAPQVSACPGCGRTTNTFFQELATKTQSYIDEEIKLWRQKYSGVEKLNIAVMGCIVNGPGESKHADVGISLPGTGEQPVAPVFVDGKKFATLRGENIAEEFKTILNEYIKKRFS